MAGRSNCLPEPEPKAGAGSAAKAREPKPTAHCVRRDFGAQSSS